MTAMTRAECERLGILSNQELRDLGEPPSSIAFIRANAGPSEASITAAADRIEAGEDTLTVFASLCAPPGKL